MEVAHTNVKTKNTSNSCYLVEGCSDEAYKNDGDVKGGDLK